MKKSEKISKISRIGLGLEDFFIGRLTTSRIPENVENYAHFHSKGGFKKLNYHLLKGFPDSKYAKGFMENLNPLGKAIYLQKYFQAKKSCTNCSSSPNYRLGLA